MSIASTRSEQGPAGLIRLMGWFLAALVAALLVGGFLQQKETKFIATLGVNSNTEKAELLLAAMLEDIITEDRARLETTVELYQASNPSFYSFAVTDEDGNSLLTWSRQSVLEPQTVLMFFRHLYQRQRTVVPVAFEGESFGQIVVEWDQSAIGAQRDSHSYVMSAAVAGLCLVFVFAGYYVGRRRG